MIQYASSVGLLLLGLTALTPAPAAAQDARPLRSTLEILDLATGERDTVLAADEHFEAPNWSPDGSYLLINSGGGLVRVDLATGTRTPVETDFADACNNDHGISPDGRTLIISHNDPSAPPDPGGNSRVYTLPAAGGTPVPVTDSTPSYWHGVSPDGNTLAYVARRAGDFDIYTIPTAGGEERRLTATPGLDDGPEFSRDGETIYLNSMRGGTMELWRIDARDGANARRLTDDAYANWFPHPSPDGACLVYLAYLEDQGSDHPPMKAVALRRYDLATGAIQTLCTFTGGQGTINVPSWAPDGRRFAFVSYAYLAE